MPPPPRVWDAAPAAACAAAGAAGAADAPLDEASVTGGTGTDVPLDEASVTARPLDEASVTALRELLTVMGRRASAHRSKLLEGALSDRPIGSSSWFRLHAWVETHTRCWTAECEHARARLQAEATRLRLDAGGSVAPSLQASVQGVLRGRRMLEAIVPARAPPPRLDSSSMSAADVATARALELEVCALEAKLTGLEGRYTELLHAIEAARAATAAAAAAAAVAAAAAAAVAIAAA